MKFTTLLDSNWVDQLGALLGLHSHAIKRYKHTNVRDDKAQRQMQNRYTERNTLSCHGRKTGLAANLAFF